MEAPVGHVWLAVRDRTSYLVDLELIPTARGRGLGRLSMLVAEDAARGLGAEVLRLNVFGHNAVAQALYERLGYAVIRAVRTRVLEPSGGSDDPPDDRLLLTRPAQVNPGHEVWTARREGQQVASVCLHWSRTGEDPRVEAHDLRAAGRDRPGLLRAVVRLAAARGAGPLAVETRDEGGDRGWVPALERLGFTLTAELREKRLVP